MFPYIFMPHCPYGHIRQYLVRPPLYNLSDANPCHTSPHVLFMANMFLVNDSKYTGGCEEWFGKLPHCRHHHPALPPPHSLDCVFRGCCKVDVWTIPGFSVTQQTPWCVSFFHSQSTLTSASSPPLLYSLQHWLQHQTACAAFSHYNWLRHEQAGLPFGIQHKSFVPPSPWVSVCACTHMCTCCIQLQRILDSITQANKRPPVPVC